MNVTVEFIGVSRVLTKAQICELSLPNDASYNKVVKALAEKHPELVGQLIDPEDFHFYGSNMFHLNGKKMISLNDMDKPVHDGDHLVLLTIFTGG
jgi:molybdopterin converting factor small subunit